MKSLIIGVAGPSNSGKTTLANALAGEIGEVLCRLISLDNYYYDLSHLSPAQRAAMDFDNPSAVDGGGILDAIQCLKTWMPIELPVYDFQTHTRRPESITIEPAPVIIVEGIFTLCYPAVVEHLDLSIFIDVDDDLALARRLKRDAEERGRSPESIIRQFRESVLPAVHAHIRPSGQCADIRLDGSDHMEDAIRRILPEIRSRISLPAP